MYFYGDFYPIIILIGVALISGPISFSSLPYQPRGRRAKALEQSFAELISLFSWMVSVMHVIVRKVVLLKHMNGSHGLEWGPLGS